MGCSRHPTKRLGSVRVSSSVQLIIVLVLLLRAVISDSTEVTERHASRRSNIAHCRDSCIMEFLSSVKGNSAHAQRDECLKANLCTACWDSCEKLRKDMATGEGICRDASLCPSGCMHACKFYKLGQQQEDEMNNWEPRRQHPLNILSNTKPQSIKANEKLYAEQHSPEFFSILESSRDIDFFECVETKCLLWIGMTMLVIIMLTGCIILFILKLKILKSKIMHHTDSSEV